VTTKRLKMLQNIKPGFDLAKPTSFGVVFEHMRS